MSENPDNKARFHKPLFGPGPAGLGTYRSIESVS